MKNALERQCVELEKQIADANEEHDKIMQALIERDLEIQYLKGMLAGLGHPVEKVTKKSQSEMENSEECECPACCEHDRKVNAALKKMGPEKIANLNQSSEEIEKWAEENDVEVGKGDASDN